MTNVPSTRRDFFGRRSPRGDAAPLISLNELGQPAAGGTIRLATRAMACDFSVVMNPGSHHHVDPVSSVLEMVHDIESWLSIYKPDSEISLVNRQASIAAVRVRRSFFELLQTALDLFEKTDGAFDMAAGAQIKLWRECRSQQRIPTDEEISRAVACSGSRHLQLDNHEMSVRFDVDGLQLDPGAIGKGFALDQASEWLSTTGCGPASYLMHGGHSSLLARGEHNDLPGWPVGIGNPLFTKQRLGTVLLHNQAMSTSGSNIQFFRHEGKRYGHIIDPRSGRTVEGMLSVTVLAESAAAADALSTAFFAMGVENAVKCCENLHNVAAVLIPFPASGRRVTPTVIGIPSDRLFWDTEQVDPAATEG
ncbi:MAG: FAD:protein FMN transferase [Planctomycetaceae bacterium]